MHSPPPDTASEPAPPAPDVVEVSTRSRTRTSAVLARRVLGFAAMPALSLVTSVAVLPAVSHNFGADGWLGIAFGQSVGAAVAAVASLHWAVEGAHEIAAHPEHRAAVQRHSVRQRLLALALLTPLTVGITVWLSPGDLVAATAMALAASAGCMTQSWLFAGMGDPGRLVLFEGAPRLAANVLSIGFLLATPFLWIYPLLLLLGTATTLLVTDRFVRRLPDQVPTLPRRVSRGSIALATSAQVSNAVYVYLLGPLISVIAPALYPVFAAGDRIAKIVLNGLAAVPAAFQSWVGGGEPAQRRQRARQASLLFAVLALLTGVVTGAAMPLVGRYVFAGTVNLEPVAWLVGAWVGAGFLNASLYLIGIVPQGHVRQTYHLLIAGAVGVPAVTVVGALLGDLTGLYLGALVGSALLIAAQASIIWGGPRLRRPR